MRSLFCALALLSTACVAEDVDAEAASSEESGESGDAELRVLYGPFDRYTIAPAPGVTVSSCPWWVPWCDDINCPSCNALTADHGHTCVSCPNGASDCNCAVGAPPFTYGGITYTNRWYPSVPPCPAGWGTC